MGLIFSGSKKFWFVTFVGSYNHAADLHTKIAWQVLREHFKWKVEESISCKPAKIIRPELLKSQATAAIRCLNI